MSAINSETGKQSVSEEDSAKVSPVKKSRFHLYLLFISIFLLSIVLIEKPIVRGDGWEYLLMTHSIRSYGTVEYSSAATESLMHTARRSSISGFPYHVHEELTQAVEQGDEFKLGFLRNSEGRYFLYHFFLYPALAAPVDAVLTLLGMNPLKSLQLTNALLVILLVAYIYYFSRLRDVEKHLLTGSFLLCGTTYYLIWPHPEVFTATLVTLSVLAWFDKRPVLAIAAAALAANHNPPVGLLVPSIFIYHHCSEILSRGGFKWAVLQRYLRARTTLSHSGWMILAGSIALASPIFYYWHYGVMNPIVAMGWTKSELITMSRFRSVWWDLNQGVVLGNLGIYFWAGIVVVASLLRLRKTQWLFPVTILVIVVLMTIPALGQKNWNAGGAIYLRYGYWLLAPLLVNVVLLTRSLPRSGIFVGVCALAFQLALVAHHRVLAKDYDITEFTGISKSIMRSHPSWYNPVPEIFAERTIGLDGGAVPDRHYEFPLSDRYVTKIMLPDSQVPSLEELARGYFSINGRSYEVIGEPTFFSIEGWTYLNGRFNHSFKVGSRIPHNSGILEWKGWSTPEQYARWTHSKEATIVLPAIKGQVVQGKLTLMGRPYAPEPMQILINGTLVYSSPAAEGGALEITIDPALLHDSQPNQVTLLLPEARQRPELEVDTRALGYALEWIILE